MNRHHTFLLFTAIAFLFAHCVDLKTVNTFAVSGQKSFETENIPTYGYTAYCYDSAYLFGKGTDLRNYTADSTHAIRYDSSIAKEYTDLASYFNALAKLSGSSESIHIENLAGTIVAGTYGSITITSEEAEAATAVGVAAKFLFTAGVRDKDLKNNINANWLHVKQALQYLALQHHNVWIKVSDLQEKLWNQSIVLTRFATSDAERWSVVYDYKEKNRKLTAVLHLYEKKQAMIQNIIDGFQKLVDDQTNWKSKDLKDKITRLSGEINYLSNSSTN